MTDHTPGPWKYRRLHADGNIITKGDYWEIFTSEYDVAAFISRGAPIRKEADARLIAAAPDLKQLGIRTISFLNALPGQNADERYFTDWFVGALKFREEWKQAIAKATDQ